DLLLGLDALDDDRQIQRQLEKLRRVHPGAGAEAHYPAGDCRAGVMTFAQQLDDGPVKRLTLVLVALSDVDAHQHALTLQTVHISSLVPTAAIIKVHDLPVYRTRRRCRLAVALFAQRGGAEIEHQRIPDRHPVRERFGLLHHRRPRPPVHEHAASARFTGTADCRILWRVHYLLSVFGGNDHADRWWRI